MMGNELPALEDYFSRSLVPLRVCRVPWNLAGRMCREVFRLRSKARSAQDDT